MTDHSEATFIWQTDPPSREVIAELRTWLRTGLSELDEPKELILQTYAITKDRYDGPTISLTGNEQFNGFNAWYTPEGGGVKFPIEDMEDITVDDIVAATKEKFKVVK